MSNRASASVRPSFNAMGDGGFRVQDICPAYQIRSRLRELGKSSRSEKSPRRLPESRSPAVPRRRGFFVAANRSTRHVGRARLDSGGGSNIASHWTWIERLARFGNRRLGTIADR
jgi:hypothetical protein